VFVFVFLLTEVEQFVFPRETTSMASQYDLWALI